MEHRKEALEAAVTPASPDPKDDPKGSPPKGSPGAQEEPVQEIRPEDEAKVVERLRELGYIE